MQHLGDITRINGLAVPIADCVVGGSPCQNLSVAGNREGLQGEESQLFHEQIRIVKEMRENDRRNGKPNELISPRYMVWENVPGAFSSNKGEDFRTVLEEVARVIEEGVTIPRPPKGKWSTTGVIIGDGWSIAWRVFDAQYWGVPQRRRRICLVADFNGHTAPQIVFGENQYNGSTDRGNSKSSVGYLGNQSRSQVQSFGKGLSRYPNESGTEGQGTPTDAQGGFGASDCYGFEPGIASREGGHIYNNKSGAIRANAGDNQASVAYTMQERAGCEGGGKGALSQADRSAGLRTVNSQTLFQPTYAIDMGGGKSSVDIHQDRSPTLTTTHYGEPAVVYDARGNGDGKTAPTMTGDHQNRVTDYIGIIVMDRSSFNQGKNAKYDMGIDENGIAHSLVAKGPGAVAYKETIALEGNGQRPSHHGDGYLVSDKSYTLNGTEVHGVAYVDTSDGDIAGTLDASYYKGCGLRQGRERTYVVAAVDCRNCTEDDTNGALQSNMAHSLNGNNVVRVKYIVRRLTPLECERLQGFPSEKKVDISKMTKDEYIAYNIAEGNIIVDAENGKVYRTRGPGGITLDKPQEMKGSDCNGYLVVKISNGTTKLTCRIHRIVWISKYGVIPEGYVIDHVNSNKKDNRISNLQLLTPAENSTKAAQDGLYATGEDNGATKISPDLHDEIAYMHHIEGKTMRQLAEIYGISKSRIHQIIKEIGWTDIGDWVDSKGKVRQTSDAARYKALGNSIALPSWKWIIKRISAQYERDATMVSLFDGIGGFPHLWEQVNGRGSCLWASEIEDFPMAVTKVRIG